MKYYKAKEGNWNQNITEVEVEKVTANSVWVNGRKHAKFSNWENYLPTFDEAKQYLLRKAFDDILKRRASLDDAITYEDTIKNLIEK